MTYHDLINKRKDNLQSTYYTVTTNQHHKCTYILEDIRYHRNDSHSHTGGTHRIAHNI